MPTSDSIRGADALARALRAAGVETIFAMSGNQIMIAFDAFLDAQIKPIHVRQEAAAVHMADATAQLTDTVGVAIVPAGPGFANALSALYTARMSESPVVLLSGHAPVARLGMGAFQEMPQATMAEPFAKASWTVRDASDIATSIARAIQIAQSGRPGPVHVAVPEDVLAAPARDPSHLTAESFHRAPLRLDETTGQRVVETLAAAKRPLILTGPRLGRGNGLRVANELESATGIPVVCMESPRGTKDPCLGAFAEVLAEADTILALGKLMDFSVQLGAALHPDCKVIDIDPEPAMLARSCAVLGMRVALSAEAGTISAAEQIIACADGRLSADPEWAKEVKQAIDYRPEEWQSVNSRDDALHAVELCRAVQARLDASPDSILIVDGGEFGQWAQACLHAPNRIINGPAGAIGSGIPYAVAAGLVKPGAPVIALMGDGSAGFHLSELDTAARSGSPFTLIIGNDARWNAEYQIQLRDYGQQRLHSCELNPTRYDEVAATFGCHGENVTSIGELDAALDRAADSGRPACLNVVIESHPAPAVQRQSA